METTFPLLVIGWGKMLVEGCKLEKHFLPVFAFCNKELPLGVTEEVVMSQAAREQKRFLGVCGSREKMAPGSYVPPIYRSGLKHQEVLFSKALILSTVLEEKAPGLTRSGDWSSEHSWRVKWEALRALGSLETTDNREMCSLKESKRRLDRIERKGYNRSQDSTVGNLGYWTAGWRPRDWVRRVLESWRPETVSRALNPSESHRNPKSTVNNGSLSEQEQGLG